MNSVCFIYYLTITPDNINSGIIKNNLDLNALKTHRNTTKNTNINAKFYLPNIDYNKLNRYYIKFEKDGYNIELVFVEIINSILITNDELTQVDYINHIDRHIKYWNNLTNQNWYNYNLSLMINNLENNRIYNINPINIDIKTQLFAYQIDNIHWMMEIENNPITGKITEDRLIKFPDGRLYNYTKNKIILNTDIPTLTFKGGIIADEMGIGKTIQLLTHCCRNPVKTLIVVPNHLTTHWENEMKKHFGQKLDFIIICDFEKFKNITFNDFERIIVDEIHETYSKSENEIVFNKLVEYPAKYKWGISGTPFAGNHSIFSIIKFLSGINFNNYLMERMQDYVPIFCKLFRKNTIANSQKFINLPNMNIENKLITFLEQEMFIYLAEKSAKDNADIDFLRKICCNVIKQFAIDEKHCITEEYLMNVILKSFFDKWQNELAIEYRIEQDIEFAKKENEKLHSEEISKNIKYFQEHLLKQKAKTKNRKSSYDFLKNQIENSQKDCPICMSEINKNTEYILTPCSHIICTSCGESWLKSHPICPVCRQSCSLGDASFVSNHQQRQIYSSKLVELLELLKSDGQFLIYTQYDFMIEEMAKVFSKENITFSIFETHEDISQFQRNNQKCLIISSQKNASGLDLSFVKNVVIFEPIIGNFNYLRDTERQIIGRVFRINQKENVNVFRLIIRNTIEEDIYKNII